MWLLFLSEIGNIFVATSYGPLFERLMTLSSGVLDVGILILIASANFHFSDKLIPSSAIHMYRVFKSLLGISMPMKFEEV
jgi:hypothetical protein